MSERKFHQPGPQTFNWKATSGPDEHLTDALTVAWDNLQLEDSESDAEYSESGEGIACAFVVVVKSNITT